MVDDAIVMRPQFRIQLSKKMWGGLTVFGSVLLLLIAVFLFAATLTGSFEARLSFTRLVLNVVLTSALLFAYLELTKVQETQQKLMKIDHVSNPKLDTIRANKDGELILELSNVGKGTANDLELIPIIIHPDWDYIQAHESQLVRNISKGDGRVSGNNNYLNPQENQTEFVTTLNIHHKDRAEMAWDQISFGFLSRILDQNNVEEFRFKLQLAYSDDVYEEKEDVILDYIVPIKGKTNLQEAIEHGVHSERHKSREFYRKKSEMEADSARS